MWNGDSLENNTIVLEKDAPVKVEKGQGQKGYDGKFLLHKEVKSRLLNGQKLTGIPISSLARLKIPINVVLKVFENKLEARRKRKFASVRNRHQSKAQEHK